jgi:hypothetical protein
MNDLVQYEAQDPSCNGAQDPSCNGIYDALLKLATIFTLLLWLNILRKQILIVH